VERLARLVAGAPEVLVKVTGRTLTARQLRVGLDYITRKGQLSAEDQEGNRLTDRQDARDLADEWDGASARDQRRFAFSPLSRSLLLSMPVETDSGKMRDASRMFAQETFAGRFDYVFVLHTDTAHPHVHMAVRALGREGQRLNPSPADLATWRESFAQALRGQGVTAEATPRRARGVTRKTEAAPVFRIRARAEAGHGPPARVVIEAYQEAAKAAFQGDTALRPWELQMTRRQAYIRGLYLAQAELLMKSTDPADRELGNATVAFVRAMPAADTRRLAMARELRDENERLRSDADRRVKERAR
jgi:type IV secretory pathway VirD2 relaxase